MFNRGIDILLQALPDIAGLPQDQLRRMLTQAWMETMDTRLGVAREPDGILPGNLRRLATALEIHAILPLEADLATTRACAFVAAEALMIAEELAPQPLDASAWPAAFGSAQDTERIEAALLYIIAGYDANAALTVKAIEPVPDTLPDSEIAAWSLGMILRLLRLMPVEDIPSPPPPPEDAMVRLHVRHELWRRIGTHVADHVRWLTSALDQNPQTGDRLRQLAEYLEDRDSDARVPAAHPDLHHLLLLLAAACDSAAGRALRVVPSPPDDNGRFARYRSTRSASRPLLWPAAEEYAARTLPGPRAHAVVTVPTGSGKSSVAELAVAQTLGQGWVLYLAPTNALVGQIRRHLAEVYGRDAVREFIGGAEYTELAGESLTDIAEHQILVMTPEKCSLALRQNPQAFSRLSLCVLDEAHLLGERNGRGAIAELVLAEVMHRATNVRLLLMSALIANPEDLAAWLHEATDIEAVVINAPWRPTRTVRAIAGLDRERGRSAVDAAHQQLKQMNKRRKNQRFLTPVALLAGLQGAWTSTVTDDYSLVLTDIEVPLSVDREGNSTDDGYCTPATAAIVQRLGERGDNVLAFLPRSKHDSFLASEQTPGFGDMSATLGPTVESYLLLAELELGVETRLREALNKGVAVHTSALLREEQRASEVAFEQETARAMYATGTMAQGLNLPATAVIIGGTDIGYDQTAKLQDKKDKARAQLLNAIGRAGRAHVAPRSIAIVVPNRALVFDSPEDAARAVRRAEFLQDEDASSAIHSSLEGLLRDILDGTLSVASMTNAEQTAFSFLSFADEHQDTSGVIAKTWAVQRAGAQQAAPAIAGVINDVGQAYIARADVPAWVALAAHQSGIPLPETLQIYRGLRDRLDEDPAPTTIPEWADLMIDLLGHLPVPSLKRILPDSPYGSSRLSDIYADDTTSRMAGWRFYREAVGAWIGGRPLIAVAQSIHRKTVGTNAKRGPQDPIPRTVSVVGDGFRFGLSLIAGSLVAFVSLGQEHDSDGPWNIAHQSLRMLNPLPLAVRSGADAAEVLAWVRAGVPTRVAAHMLDELLPAPQGQTDDDLQRWAHGRLRELIEDALPGIASPSQNVVIRAIELTRAAR